MSKRIFECAAISAFLLAASPAMVSAAPFSIDVNHITYSYGSTVHTPDFSVPNGFAPGYQDPVSGWYLEWNALETPVTSGAVGDVWRMTTPQATPSTPAPRALSSINGYGPPQNITGLSPSDWQVSALISNIANATTVGTFYDVRVGGGTFDPSGVGVHVDAAWFTGDFSGTHYDNLLHIGSHISLAGFEWNSSGDGSDIFLTDLNPQDTVLELMVDITNGGQTLSTYYKRDGEASWNLAQTHTLPVGIGVLSGFASSHPYVALSDEVAVVPEPAAMWLFGLGALVLIGVSRSRLASA